MVCSVQEGSHRPHATIIVRISGQCSDCEMKIVSQAAGASLEKCRYSSQRNTVSQRNVLRVAEIDCKLGLLDTSPPPADPSGAAWT